MRFDCNAKAEEAKKMAKSEADAEVSSIFIRSKDSIAPSQNLRRSRWKWSKFWKIKSALRANSSISQSRKKSKTKHQKWPKILQKQNKT
jgi:hypothetical protein